MQKDNDSEGRESRLASGWTVEGAPSAKAPAPTPEPEALEAPSSALEGDAAGEAPADAAGEAEITDTRVQMSNAALVVLGVFGGIYLMYTWVWFSWAEYYESANNLLAASSGSLGGVLQQIVFWVAPLAPIGWFLCALLLNRGAPTWRLALWIVIGAVVLVPLPMFTWGA
ncbi:hypothetical protein [Leucobacter salsicius]|uniref:hypothetical protein n=1 Tax=Leucobacter salsicius TaxID=664638 RepID=UPI0003493E78|nr:hypothetical protein [Leucobacter salsicius]